MQKPITETFEFFEYLHLILAYDNKIEFFLRLYMLGNLKMQNLIKQFSKTLILKSNYKNNLIIKQKHFENVQYLKLQTSNFFLTMHHKLLNFDAIKNIISKNLKALDIHYYTIENHEMKFLPKTLLYLNFNAQNFGCEGVVNLPQNLIYLYLNNGWSINNNFIQLLPKKIQYLKIKTLITNDRNYTITHLTDLIFLKLNCGYIKTILIENCPNLTKLNLYMNYIGNFPPSILQLLNLKILNLSYNEIVKIPDEISNLINLEELILCKNRIDKFSEAITLLINLKILNVSGNRIKNISNSISQLYNLQKLNFSDNYFNEFPNEIIMLTNLQFLDFSINKIQNVPNSISQLQKLQELNLNNNYIREINLNLPNLKKLNLDCNKLVQMSLETPNLNNLIVTNNKRFSLVYDEFFLNKFANCLSENNDF